MRRGHKRMNNGSSFHLNGRYFNTSNSQLKSKLCDCTQRSLLTICLRAPHLKWARSVSLSFLRPCVIQLWLLLTTFTAVLSDAWSWARLNILMMLQAAIKREKWTTKQKFLKHNEKTKRKQWFNSFVLSNQPFCLAFLRPPADHDHSISANNNWWQTD